MTRSRGRDSLFDGLRRRTLLRYSVAAAVAVAWGGSAASTMAQSVDLSQWSPDYIRSIAGTEEVDTAADCAAVTPLDYTGRLSYWWSGPTDASPDIDRRINDEFWAAYEGWVDAHCVRRPDTRFTADVIAALKERGYAIRSRPDADNVCLRDYLYATLPKDLSPAK